MLHAVEPALLVAGIKAPQPHIVGLPPRALAVAARQHTPCFPVKGQRKHSAAVAGHILVVLAVGLAPDAQALVLAPLTSHSFCV